MNNTSKTAPSGMYEISLEELITWCVFNGLIGIGAIVGNILVIVAFFRYKRLRTRTNYFIAGLSFADLIVGLASIPMWTAIIVTVWLKTTQWMKHEIYRSYLALDYFSGVLSILHLMLVSIERLYAIGWPVKHRVSLKKHYLVVLAITWLVSLATFTLFVPKKEVTHIPRFFVLLILFFIPLLVILATYFAIWWIVSYREHGTNYWTPNKEVKLAVILFSVSILFVIAWMPFIVMNIVSYLCSNCFISTTLVYFSKLLHYSNSMANPIVYSFRMPEFKKAFICIIKRHDGIKGYDVRLQSLRSSLESRSASASNRVKKKDSSLRQFQETKLLSSKACEVSSV